MLRNDLLAALAVIVNHSLIVVSIASNQLSEYLRYIRSCTSSAAQEWFETQGSNPATLSNSKNISWSVPTVTAAHSLTHPRIYDAYLVANFAVVVLVLGRIATIDAIEHADARAQ